MRDEAVGSTTELFCMPIIISSLIIPNIQLFISKECWSFNVLRFRAVPDIRARLQGAAVTIQTEAADNPNLNKSTDPDPIMVGSNTFSENYWG